MKSACITRIFARPDTSNRHHHEQGAERETEAAGTGFGIGLHRPIMAEQGTSIFLGPTSIAEEKRHDRLKEGLLLAWP